MKRKRLAAGGKLANFLGVVKGGDVAPRTSDGDRVQEFEKVEIERGKNSLRCALLRRQL